MAKLIEECQKGLKYGFKLQINISVNADVDLPEYNLVFGDDQIKVLIFDQLSIIHMIALALEPYNVFLREGLKRGVDRSIEDKLCAILKKYKWIEIWYEKGLFRSKTSSTQPFEGTDLIKLVDSMGEEKTECKTLGSVFQMQNPNGKCPDCGKF